MVEVNGLKFATSIGVLFALKESRGHTTLQETYKSMSTSDFDNVLDVLRVCCEQGENKHFTLSEFLALLGKHEIGFVKTTHIFKDILERVMYDGLSSEERESTKKFLMGKAPH